MKETLKQRLDRIGAEAEAAEANQTDQTIAPHVKVSRPNQARSKVLQVRLNPEEFDAIERLAAQRGLPASTVARERLLQMIREDDATEADIATQLAAAADRIKALVAQVHRPAAPHS
jgi:hypothetical protein